MSPPLSAIQCYRMRRFENRESFRVAHEFFMTTHKLCDAVREIRPASSWRVESAAGQIVHYIIHSHGRVQRRGGQWRIARALAAAGAAHRALDRIHTLPEWRVQASAALEVLERLIKALEQEQTA